MIIFKKTIFPILLILSFFACKDDNADSLSENKNPTANINTNLDNNIGREALQKVITSSTIKTKLHINVKDNNGENLNGVLVEVSGIKISTNDGNAIFEDIEINKEFVVIKASKKGYFSTLKTVTFSDTSFNAYGLTLYKAEEGKKLSVAKGGNLIFKNKVNLAFPKQAIVDRNGVAVSGDINVQLQYHDPTLDNFIETQPGTLVGLSTNNQLEALQSFGMISVELKDNNGEKVFIKEGQSVKVTMPVIENSPSEIPLWHLNEQAGIWVETGKATKKGGEYEFNVTHFSSYNLDVKVDAVQEVKFKFSSLVDGKLLSNTKIEVFINNELAENMFIGPLMNIVTDNSGEITLLRAPKGEYSFKLKSLCIGAETGLASNDIVIVNDEELLFDIGFDIQSSTLSTSFIKYRGEFFGCDDMPVSFESITHKSDLELNIFNSKFNLDEGYNINFSFCNELNIKEFILKITGRKESKTFIEEVELEVSTTNEFIVRDIKFCDTYKEDEISIDDKRLRQQIFENLTPNFNSITRENLLSLIELKKASRAFLPIKDFTNINLLENLQKVEITPGLRLDLNPLKDLNKLTEFTLLSNGSFSSETFIDLQPLTEIETLRTLEIDGRIILNNITKLNQIKKLKLNNQVIILKEEATNLANDTSGFPNLKELDFAVQLTDYSLISKFQAIENLRVDYTHPFIKTDINQEFLLNLPNLKKLDLCGNNTNGSINTSIIERLVKLDELMISNDSIEEYTFLYELTNLKKLYICGDIIDQNQINQIGILQERLPNTEVLAPGIINL